MVTDVAETARSAANSRQLGWLARLGLTARALVYLVMGWLAILLLFVLAFDMVMQRPSGLRATESERSEAEASDDDVSVFPLAIPLIAGPGAMTSVVLLRGRAGSDYAELAAVMVALLVALGITLAALLAAGTMTRVIGKTGTHVIGRVLGVVLAALSAQLVIDGIRQSFGLG